MQNHEPSLWEILFCQILTLFYLEIVVCRLWSKCKRPMFLLLYCLKHAPMLTYHSSPYRIKYINFMVVNFTDKFEMFLCIAQNDMHGNPIFFFTFWRSQYLVRLRPDLKWIWAKNGSGLLISIRETKWYKYQ